MHGTLGCHAFDLHSGLSYYHSMFLSCPKCAGPINRHDYILGFVCENRVGGRVCDYTSNPVIFSQPLPTGIFGYEFLKKLLAAPGKSLDTTIPETTSE